MKYPLGWRYDIGQGQAYTWLGSRCMVSTLCDLVVSFGNICAWLGYVPGDV